MKAKVIKTGEVIEVHRNISGWASDDQLNKTRLFDESELDFDYQDWELFRREAAKDILAGMVSHPRVSYGNMNAGQQARLAIQYADELIKQLKEK